MQKLTKEQAIIISGYTGILMCKFSLLHEDIEKRLGRPVFTHEFADEDFFSKKVSLLYIEDFLATCYQEAQNESWRPLFSH